MGPSSGQWGTEKKLVCGLDEKLCRMRLNMAEQWAGAETCRVAKDKRLLILRGAPPSLNKLTSKNDVYICLAAVGAIEQSEVTHGDIAHVEKDWRR